MNSMTHQLRNISHLYIVKFVLVDNSPLLGLNSFFSISSTINYEDTKFPTACSQ